MRTRIKVSTWNTLPPMNSGKGSPMPVPQSSPEINLVIAGLGHIPAIKNSMFAIVAKENRKWKLACVNDFVSQLYSSMQTCGPGMQMQPFLLSLIASLPRDDSWRDIPELSVKCLLVAKGEEGASIKIEPI